MTGERDTIDQIEYRWHDRRDLSPVASTLPPESLMSWDSWIRAWVRHPHLDGLSESVCYQVLPSGRAALAWRYETDQAAGREGGSQGRPLVSRVLAGHSSRLTPQVAIALCHSGLPEAVGPRPGQVTAQAPLQPIAASELAILADERARELDQAATEHGDFLRQVIAQALFDPDTPLAISLGDSYILRRPERGVQSPVLWGLWRTVRPVVGLAVAGRGWSFSTFELPLEDVDPQTLPDILFRQIRDASVAPAKPRKELKLRPFESRPHEELKHYFELADWLLAEYKKKGGDELGQLVTGWCGAEPSLLSRLNLIYRQLQAAWAQPMRPGPTEPELAGPAESGPVLPGPPAPASGATEIDPLEPATSDSNQTVEHWLHGLLEPALDQADRGAAGADEREGDSPGQPVRSTRPAVPEGGLGRPRAVPRRLDFNSYPGDLDSPDDSLPEMHSYPEPVGKHRAAATNQVIQAQRGRQTVSELLKRLPESRSLKECSDILRGIQDDETRSDADDRVKSRREVSKAEWCHGLSQLYGDSAIIDVLAEIFCVIVLPDLANRDAIKKIIEWVDQAAPPMIGGLLEAARKTDMETWQAMMRLLEPTLAYRWLSENDLHEMRPPLAAAQPSADMGRNIFGRFRRGSNAPAD